ncbi:MAG TPA: DUF4239 domain-containing protein [Candidatus Eisenbacteria bacterium]|nr:DUF4239 domain-containing protein [Candidatus Eisenbacteria bacterium]
MKPPIQPLLFAVLLFTGMLIMLEVGRQIGIKRRPKESDSERGSLGTVEGALFALFGLVVAFTFSGAASRFNEKRALIAEEANAIETAYLRVHLVSQKAQPELRELFRNYIDSRLETYHKLPDMEAARVEMEHSEKLQKEIWTKAISATVIPDSHVDAGKLLLPALNNMIDICTTRTMALQNHPPSIIYVLLFILGLICSLLAGYRMAIVQHRSWLHILSFALVTVIVIYVILDVEYPRAGLIHLHSFDQVLANVRARMD